MHGRTATGPTPVNSRPTISAASPGSGGNSSSSSDMGPVYALVAILVLYVVWALVAAHQRVKESVEPKNIAINIWNLTVIAITVVLAINLLKIAATKLAAWNVPGAQAFLTMVANT